MPKRFYKEVAVAPDGEAFAVLLDGRPLRTPGRHQLILPNAALARAIADEWAAQGDEIVPDNMPLTRLATTVVDLMPARRNDAINDVMAFAGTDLLCYRAGHPADLAERQAAAWQPWLDWAATHLDAGLKATSGIAAIAQDEAALHCLTKTVAALDDWRLTGLHAATTLTGSVILGLALERGAIARDQAFEAAVLDELYQMERWGEEADLLQRHARLRRDLDAAVTFFELLA